MEKTIKTALVGFCALFFLALLPFPVKSASKDPVITQYEAVYNGRNKVKILTGPLKGKEYKTLPVDLSSANKISFSKGDNVIVAYSKDPRGTETVYIVDRVRRNELLILFFAFLVFVFAIGQIKGLTSILGMLFSYLVIAFFIVPNIILGNDPVLISLLGSIFIIPATFYLAHGVNKKTTISVISTFIALALTGALSFLFVNLTRLTGFAAEEAVFLQSAVQGAINIKSLLLAGIIVGAMGVLDDITISQTAIVEKLHSTNREMRFRTLYKHAMDVGRDHIASLVNTLVLVYTGAALPLFLLFYNAKTSYMTIFNQELIATEIVRTLVSSMGIIAAVPITTFIAAYSYAKQRDSLFRKKS